MFDAAAGALDWLGVLVFAASGALAAARKGMDLVGFALLAVATGIGGGTIRDVLLGRLPVFWVGEPLWLLACVGAGLAVFVVAPRLRGAGTGRRLRLLLWLDAVGLAVFAVTGAETARLAGAGPVVAVAMGAVTASFGGILRDVLAGEQPVVLSREIYVTAALAGAAVFVAALPWLGREGAMALGFVAGFGLRGAALRRGWSLPRTRPPRP